MKSVVLAGLLALLPPPAHASDVTQKDIQIIGRALGFVEDLGTGPLDLGIVYVRGDKESFNQATATKAMVDTEPNAGKVLLHARLVASDEVATLDHVGALFVVPAAEKAQEGAAAAGRRLRIPVTSTRLACAEAGYCVLAVSSSPTVEITFNRNAAELSGVRFTPAFRMLVRKI